MGENQTSMDLIGALFNRNLHSLQQDLQYFKPNNCEFTTTFINIPNNRFPNKPMEVEVADQCVPDEKMEDDQTVPNEETIDKQDILPNNRKNDYLLERERDFIAHIKSNVQNGIDGHTEDKKQISEQESKHKVVFQSEELPNAQEDEIKKNVDPPLVPSKARGRPPKYTKQNKEELIEKIEILKIILLTNLTAEDKDYHEKALLEAKNGLGRVKNAFTHRKSYNKIKNNEEPIVPRNNDMEEELDESDDVNQFPPQKSSEGSNQPKECCDVFMEETFCCSSDCFKPSKENKMISVIENPFYMAINHKVNFGSLHENSANSVTRTDKLCLKCEKPLQHLVQYTLFEETTHLHIKIPPDMAQLVQYPMYYESIFGEAMVLENVVWNDMDNSSSSDFSPGGTSVKKNCHGISHFVFKRM